MTPKIVEVSPGVQLLITWVKKGDDSRDTPVVARFSGNLVAGNLVLFTFNRLVLLKHTNEGKDTYSIGSMYHQFPSGEKLMSIVPFPNKKASPDAHENFAKKCLVAVEAFSKEYQDSLNSQSV